MPKKFRASWTNSYQRPSVRIPPYDKENKAISGAEDDAKSAEVGTHEVGHRSDLSRAQSYTQAGKF